MKAAAAVMRLSTLTLQTALGTLIDISLLRLLGGFFVKTNKYTLRTIVAGILVYVILELLFPGLSVILQVLLAFAIFFVLLWFVPGIRRFFIGPKQ